MLFCFVNEILILLPVNAQPIPAIANTGKQLPINNPSGSNWTSPHLSAFLNTPGSHAPHILNIGGFYRFI